MALAWALLPAPDACYKAGLRPLIAAWGKDGQVMAFKLARREGVGHVGLKAPGIITFMTSVILAVILLVSKFFGAEIPALTGNEFWALLVAYAILMFGCLLRGL